MLLPSAAVNVSGLPARRASTVVATLLHGSSDVVEAEALRYWMLAVLIDLAMTQALDAVCSARAPATGAPMTMPSMVKCQQSARRQAGR
jgi:hypothetical protein